jgi:2-iminobutanoate/2-iminopropanoate deaminase
MSRKAIVTDAAPAAIGPYSQAIRSGSLLFCSGQIPIDPSSGELVSGDIAAETRQVMENLGAVLRAAEGNFSNVVKTTIFLADMADFVAVNEVYAEYFGDPPPARATVAVAGLPKGVRVEIEATAVLTSA